MFLSIYCYNCGLKNTNCLKPPIYRQCGQSGHRQFKSRNSYNCAQRYKGARDRYQREFRGARGGGYREKGTRGLYEEEQSLQTEIKKTMSTI